MARRVIEGTPRNFITVRPADLPTNADFSYLRYVNLRGNWGPTRSLRYLDLVDSRCDADLRRADITGIETLHTNCTNIKVTAEQADLCEPGLSWAFVRDRARTYIKDVMGKSDAIVDEMSSFDNFWLLSETDRRSYSRLAVHWRNIMGATTAETRALIEHVFGELPKLTRQQINNDSANHERPNLRVKMFSNPDIVWLSSGWSQPMLDALQKRDRWQLARAAEAASPIPIIALCRRLWSAAFDFIAIPERFLTHPEEFGRGISGTPAERRALLDRTVFKPRLM